MNQDFRNFRPPPTPLPVELAGFVFNLSWHFNFTSGKPIRRTKMTLQDASELLGVGVKKCYKMTRELQQWQESNGYLYIYYNKNDGLRFAVAGKKLGRPVVEQQAILGGSSKKQQAKQGGSTSHIDTLNKPNREDEQAKQGGSTSQIGRFDSCKPPQTNELAEPYQSLTTINNSYQPLTQKEDGKDSNLSKKEIQEVDPELQASFDKHNAEIKERYGV